MAKVIVADTFEQIGELNLDDFDSSKNNNEENKQINEEKKKNINNEQPSEVPVDNQINPQQPSEVQEITQPDEKVEDIWTPGDGFEEVAEQKSDADLLNESLPSIREKIDYALAYRSALRIVYVDMHGNHTERTIWPDYEIPTKTTNHSILVAWDELRGGWRAFLTDPLKILAAKLELTTS